MENKLDRRDIEDMSSSMQSGSAKKAVRENNREAAQIQNTPNSKIPANIDNDVQAELAPDQVQQDGSASKQKRARRRRGKKGGDKAPEDKGTPAKEPVLKERNMNSPKVVRGTIFRVAFWSRFWPKNDTENQAKQRRVCTGVLGEFWSISGSI